MSYTADPSSAGILAPTNTKKRRYNEDEGDIGKWTCNTFRKLNYIWIIGGMSFEIRHIWTGLYLAANNYYFLCPFRPFLLDQTPHLLLFPSGVEFSDLRSSSGNERRQRIEILPPLREIQRRWRHRGEKLAIYCKFWRKWAFIFACFQSNCRVSVDLLVPSPFNSSYSTVPIYDVMEENLHNGGGVGSVEEWSYERVKMPDSIQQGSRIRLDRLYN